MDHLAAPYLEAMPNAEVPPEHAPDLQSPGDQPSSPSHAAPEPPAAASTRAPMPGKALRIIGTLAVVVAILGGYFSLLGYFQDEADSRSTEVSVGDASGERGLSVTAWLVSVDQQQEQAVLRLNFEYTGDILAEDGTLARPLRLFLNSANAAQDRTFEKGKAMNPTDVTVDLYDSSITRYPFDRFKADLYMAATVQMPVAAAPEQPVEGETPVVKAPETTETVLVPVAIDFFGGLHGLKVKSGATSVEDGYTEVGFQVSRSNTTLAIAWFIMVVLLSVAITVLIITLTIVLWGRKLELPIIGLLGALMFGFVAFRNTLPGTPPIGSMSDYIAFFWAEGIVASCLFALVATYLKRTMRPGKTA